MDCVLQAVQTCWYHRWQCFRFTSMPLEGRRGCFIQGALPVCIDRLTLQSQHSEKLMGQVMSRVESLRSSTGQEGMKIGHNTCTSNLPIAGRRRCPGIRWDPNCFDIQTRSLKLTNLTLALFWPAGAVFAGTVGSEIRCTICVQVYHQAPARSSGLTFVRTDGCRARPCAAPGRNGQGGSKW